MDGMGGLLLHSHPSLLSFGSVCRNIMYVHTHTRSYQQNCYYTFRFLGPGAVLWLYLKHISFALCAAFYWNKSHITVRARASYNNRHICIIYICMKESREEESLLWDKCWFFSCRKVKITQQQLFWCWQIGMTFYWKNTITADGEMKAPAKITLEKSWLCSVNPTTSLHHFDSYYNSVTHSIRWEIFYHSLWRTKKLYSQSKDLAYSLIC